MKFIKKEIAGLKFYCRPGSDDAKTVEEVVGKKKYQKKNLYILEGTIWLDLGAHIGAFAVFALSRGAKVVCYEPDPYSYRLLQENIILNGYSAEIHNVAVVHDQKPEGFLHISKKGEFSKNGMLRLLGGEALRVKCTSFQEAINKTAEDYVRRVNVKLSIEGMETKIIEAGYNANFIQNMVVDWNVEKDQRKFYQASRKTESQFKEVKIVDVNQMFCFDGHD